MARWILTGVFFVTILFGCMFVLAVVTLVTGGDGYQVGYNVINAPFDLVRGSLIGMLIVLFYIVVGVPMGIFLCARWLTDRLIHTPSP